MSESIAILVNNKNSLSVVSSFMRLRRALLFITFILTVNVSFYLLFRPFPTIRTLVERTNKRLHGSVRNVHVHELEVDRSYLEYLGLLRETSAAGDGLLKTSENVSPSRLVVGSAVSSSDYMDAYALVISVRQVLPDTPLILFDIGLTSWDINQLKRSCNETMRCSIRGFEFDKFPRHVEHLYLKAYKPLALQMLLRDHGAVLWTDLTSPPYYLVAGPTELAAVQTQARQSGLVAWSLPPPTSALTHPKMFSYLKARPRDYFFHRMVSSAHLLVYNTMHIHKNVMRPWAKCALSAECLTPLGAQQVGCNFQRQPYFRYSGCHFYEMSALNVILGQAFNFEVNRYECHVKIFGFNVNDTDLQNHFHITGLDFNEWKKNLRIS